MGIHVKKDNYSVEVGFSPSGDLMVRYSANIDGCEANVTKVVTDASPAIKEAACCSADSTTQFGLPISSKWADGGSCRLARHITRDHEPYV